MASRAGFCCEYCISQADYSPDSFSVEHIIPLSKGGTNNLNNLAYSCQGCNNRKYNQADALAPISNNKVPLFNPRKQSWENHFQWNGDQTIIIGISPSGRATVHKLDLNRKGVVNLRDLLAIVGEHPPRIGVE